FFFCRGLSPHPFLQLPLILANVPAAACVAGTVAVFFLRPSLAFEVGVMAGDVIVETRKLTKIYRDFWGRQKKTALRALNIEIRKGEIFGLLGPNGSGKTTTIKLLLGLLFPTDGEAFVFGKAADDVTKNEKIGYLPEESYLYRFLNA